MFLSLFPGFVNAWAGYYGNHPLVSATVHFLHVAAIALGGGAALTTDYWVIKNRRADLSEKKWVISALNRIHGYVAIWMSLLVASGVLMTAADAGTFLASKLYWTKIALVILLLANGVVMLQAERRVLRVGIAAGFQRLVITSTISLSLWLIIIFASTLLTVAA